MMYLLSENPFLKRLAPAQLPTYNCRPGRQRVGVGHAFVTHLKVSMGWEVSMSPSKARSTMGGDSCGWIRSTCWLQSTSSSRSP